MPVTKRTRYEVLRRDNHTCRYCGAAAPDATLTVDHVTPVALGGTDEPSNLVAACRDCNAGKASTSPDAAVVEDVAQDAMRWAAAIKQAASVLATETEERARQNGEFEDIWSKCCLDWRGDPAERPDDWPEQLDLFRSRGLPQIEVIDALWVAIGKRKGADSWRYFCGVCWRKLDRIHEAAKALLETEGDA